MKKYLIVLFLLFTFNQIVLATQQEPDYLIFKGDTLAINNYPLEKYFENHPRPDSLFNYTSSSCWRGYVAYWKIEGDRLLLSKIEKESGEKLDFSEIFIDRDTNNKIYADWYSSSIFCYSGERLSDFVYENEIEFLFKNGNVIDQKICDNKKVMKMITSFFDENIDYSKITTITKSKTKVFLRISSVAPDGQIKDVEIIKGVDDERNKEAVRVVKLLPDLKISYCQKISFFSGMVLLVRFNSNN